MDFTVISSKVVTLRYEEGAKGKRTSGKSMQFFAIGVNLKAAVDKAIENAGPDYDALIDGVLLVKQYPFYGGYVVEGTPIKTTKLRADLGEAGFENYAKAHKLVEKSDKQ
ncbi:MAG: hypothetical protein V4543_06535 [Bacteroidota bacterium]